VAIIIESEMSCDNVNDKKYFSFFLMNSIKNLIVDDANKKVKSKIPSL
jgi:hypothetical protein